MVFRRVGRDYEDEREWYISAAAAINTLVTWYDALGQDPNCQKCLGEGYTYPPGVLRKLCECVDKPSDHINLKTKAVA